MAIRKRKPTSPGRRFQTVSDFSEITKTTPEKHCLLRSRTLVDATRTVARHHVTVVARTSVNTESLISSASKTECLPRLLRLNMTRTAHAASRSCITKTEPRRTFWLQKVLKLDNALRVVKAQTSNQVTHFRCGTSLSEQLCTTSNCDLVKVAKWLALPEQPCS